MKNKVLCEGNHIQVIQLENGLKVAKIKDETSSFLFDESVAKDIIKQLKRFIQIVED
ncbi:hypothetical protein SDC9_07440 [bioreactor metagenome]|uniref:Uncharacterized protein n=1 Tax=bioreactor metagenome TaxID=1076179 RepID=A0A644T7F9_9ZZZZ|nr:hypothetical protein [Methanobrevibacter sp.]MEA4956896.1 hypothetical protein [Methanobrevibacter sp.]